MSLKTNSKKARENIRQWILDNLGSDYEAGTFQEAAKIINEHFYAEMIKHDNRYKAGRVSRFELFKDWTSGLPGALCCDDIYLRPVVPVLARILEETEAEASKYSEDEAEAKLVALIYRELEAVA